jgi:SAM-dependent methyltransferase
MPFSTDELRKRLAAQQWTAHNVRLNDECSTRPGEADFMTTDLRLQAIVRVLDLLFGSDLRGVRAADLGCLEGGFSLALAQRGAEVTGIEARRRNLEKAMLLRDHFGLPNLQFQLGDVKDFGGGGAAPFDVVLALGILYHLDKPAEWLRQVAAATRRVLVLETHFAPADDATLARIDPRLKLSPLETRDEGGWPVEGRWFHEFGKDADREAQLWASYSNFSSFWLTKKSLLQSTCRAGFALVFEQHDYSAGSYDHLNVTFPRCLLIAIKN